LLRTIPLILTVLFFTGSAFAQTIPTLSAADKAATTSAAQAFGTNIRKGTVLPTQGASGAITLPGLNGTTSTITPDQLIPAKGVSKLSKAAGNDAGVRAATSAAIIDANKSASPWGEAYRTIKGNGGSKHINLTNDPLWTATDKSMANTFSKSFANCVPSTGPTTTTSWLPDIKHCIANSALQTTCHITHKTGTKLVPAPKRCDPTTFKAIKKTLYSTARKTIKDTVSCSTSGNFVHSLTSNTVVDTPHKCSIVDPVTNTCNITHSYSVTASSTCRQGSSTVNSTLWLGDPYQHWVLGTSGVNLGVRSSCGAPGVAPTITLIARGAYQQGSIPVCGSASKMSFKISTQPLSTKTPVATLSMYNSGACYPAISVSYTTTGCDSQGHCPVTLYVDDGTHKIGCADGSQPVRRKVGRRYKNVCIISSYPFIVSAVRIPLIKTVNVTLTKNSSVSTVTDNGWVGHPSTCSSLIADINSGKKTGTFTCGLDPANGQQCVNLAGGRVCQSDMTSPFTGISSLCQRVDVSATTPRVDGCVTYKNDPKCTRTKSSCAAGTCHNTYVCSKTMVTSSVLTGCSSGNCAASL